jgi:hypothetical protein
VVEDLAAADAPADTGRQGSKFRGFIDDLAALLSVYGATCP